MNNTTQAIKFVKMCHDDNKKIYVEMRQSERNLELKRCLNKLEMKTLQWLLYVKEWA
jgi:hypothetical protein